MSNFYLFIIWNIPLISALNLLVQLFVIVLVGI